jgi:hypothetical protein
LHGVVGYGQNGNVACFYEVIQVMQMPKTLQCHAKVWIIYHLPYSDALWSNMKLILRNQVASLCLCIPLPP